MVAAGLILATLANGAYGYLARLGLLDRPQYEEIVRTYCPTASGSHAPLGASCRCMHIREGVDYSIAPWPDYLFRTDGYRLAFKLVKEVLFAGALMLSLALLPSPRRGEAKKASLIAPALFVAVLVLGTVNALSRGGFGTTIPGLRSVEFVAVAALAAWLAPRLDVPAKALLALLAMEAVLVGIELLFGMPVRSCPNSFRAAGTLVLPNSLGVVVAVAMAFCAAFAPARIGSAWPWLAAAWLVLASGSGSGIVLLVVLGAWQLRPHFKGGARVAIACGLLATLLLVPVLTQRPQIYDSLLSPEGRVSRAVGVLEGATPLELVAGQGIGAGTNAAANVTAASPSAHARTQPVPEPFYADSTLTSFLLQFGLLGVASWLALLVWAWASDPPARPFYLVLAIASVVMNVTELFPVNFLLGLALAHTLVAARLLMPPCEGPLAEQPR